MIDSAFKKSRISSNRLYSEDRGDGALILASPAVPKGRLLADVPAALAEMVREYNQDCEPAERLGIRMSFHAGEVAFDRHGVVGAPIDYAFRLTDAAQRVTSLGDSFPVLSLVVSKWIFDDVIYHNPELSPESYHQMLTTVRSTPVSGYLRVSSDRLEAVNDAGEFDEFYISNFVSVRNILNSWARDRTLAEEVTDEAMAIAYRRWDEVRHYEKPVGFVVRTAQRILIRIRLQRARKDPPTKPLSLQAAPGLDTRATEIGPEEIAVSRMYVEQLLQKLPPGQRECFVLHVIFDHPIRYIAQLLEVPEGTVKTRLRAARRTLHDLLNNDMGEEGGK